jgi:hypothetical protein
MRLLISLMVLAAPAVQASWPKVLAAAGLEGSPVTVLEGSSAEAARAGFRPLGGQAPVEVRSVKDAINPSLQIVWAQMERVPRYEVPAEATVFTRERWTGAPLAAGLRREGRVVFWTATGLGERGSERYPYLPQALMELGLRPKTESRALWAFFDSSYRLRADPDYLAARWRSGGIAALHIAAWHYWEPDEQRDAWLKRLIEACHRKAITTYAWVELPHVSEEFWRRHPEWREQTAAGQDAHLDWRRLMNLTNRDCAEAVNTGLRDLLQRFDWDGVNLGELYFESLEGYLNPARFTPFNADVRRRFAERHGVDPKEFYDPQSRAYHLRDARPLRRFLEFRAEVAGELQAEWLERIESIRKEKPWLDVALTHVDDRFDTTMRDSLGADAARLLPVAARHGATFLVEDPATVWHLGPERYEEMARRYRAITPAGSSLAVDLNVVERYQDVYPTRQQTGTELFQLVRAAARSFPRVALYFENSVLGPDWPLLAAAGSAARAVEQAGGGWAVDAPQTTALAWDGCARVNGAPWRAKSQGRLLLPAGQWLVEKCAGGEAPLIADFNGELRGLAVEGGRLRIDYESRTRAIVILPGQPERAILLPPGKRTEWMN